MQSTGNWINPIYAPTAQRGTPEENSGTASISECKAIFAFGVNILSENAFRVMPTLADRSSDFGFSSEIQV